MINKEVFIAKGLTPEAYHKVQEGVQTITDFCKRAKIGSTRLLALLDVANYYHAEVDLFHAEAVVDDFPKDAIAPVSGLVVARLNRAAVLRDIEHRRTTLNGHGRDYSEISMGATMINDGYFIREGCRVSLVYTSATLESILTNVRGFPMITPEVYRTH